MKAGNPSASPRNELNITKEGVISIIRQVIELDGLEAAKAEYKRMCVLYATFPGWSEAAAELVSLLKEVRRQQEAEQARQQGQPPVYIRNEVGWDARSYTIPHVDKLMDHADISVLSPGNVIAKEVKI